MTSTVTSLVEPSPSAAIWRASASQVARRAAQMAGKAAESSSMASSSASPVAKSMQQSLVEVSESTVTLLKLWLTARPRATRAALGVSGASVESTESIVAMSGWIMPEPLAKPPTWTSMVPSPGAGRLPT